MPFLLFCRRSKNACPLTKASPRSAGFDLCAANPITIPARGRGLIETRLQILLPEGTYGRIAPRSGLALHKGLDIAAGVVDIDYSGPICVVMFNHSDEDFNVGQGDRIAQLIVEKISYPDAVEIKKIPKSKRCHGFGSSGLK